MRRATPSLRCLWLARALPFPADSGDRIYSAQLASALAEAGARVTFVGHAAPVQPPGPGAVVWDSVPGGCRPTWRALASPQPLNGAIHDTPAYRKRLGQWLMQEWELVVLDHAAMAWALPEVQRRTHQRTRPPVIVHVSHNHETSLWQGMVRQFRGGPHRRLGLWQNSLKVRRAEQRLVAAADLLCCITAEDALAFERDDALVRTLVLTPGFAGLRVSERTLDGRTPRRVLMMGSYRWVAKQQNLRALVLAADPVFTAQGITLDVVGDMPPELHAELSRYPSVTLHGFVEDLSPLLQQARLALVPEVIGGGFKLKLLDYLFGRVPVLTLDAAAAGLPASVRRALLRCDDLPALVAGVAAHIDDLPLLDQLQQEAHAAALALFDWPDRGAALRDAVRALSAEPRRGALKRPTPNAWA